MLQIESTIYYNRLKNTTTQIQFRTGFSKHIQLRNKKKQTRSGLKKNAKPKKNNNKTNIASSLTHLSPVLHFIQKTVV